MLTFIPGKTYKFGVFTKTGEQQPNDYVPVFAQRPSAVSIDGANLKIVGVKNFNDYLRINPHGFPVNRIVHCYEFDPVNKVYIKLAEGNPLPKTKEEPGQGLNDNPNNSPYNQQINQGGSNDIPANIQRMYKDQIDVLNEQVKNLQSALTNIQDKLIETERSKIELETEKAKLAIEVDALKGIVENHIGNGGQGLNDGPMAKMMEIGAGLAANPEVQGFISGLFSSLSAKYLNKGQPKAAAEGQFKMPANGIPAEPVEGGYNADSF